MLLIDPTELVTRITHLVDSDHPNDSFQLSIRQAERDAIIKLIAAMPHIEAEVVSCGHWVSPNRAVEDQVIFECSHCGGYLKLPQGLGVTPMTYGYNFCPCCGDRMSAQTGDSNFKIQEDYPL